jgi:hypothetical protein
MENNDNYRFKITEELSVSINLRTSPATIAHLAAINSPLLLNIANARSRVIKLSRSAFNKLDQNCHLITHHIVQGTIE